MANFINVAPEGRPPYITDVDNIAFVASDGIDVYFFLKQPNVYGNYLLCNEIGIKISPDIHRILQQESGLNFITLQFNPENFVTENSDDSSIFYSFPASSLQSLSFSSEIKKNSEQKDKDKFKIELLVKYLGKLCGDGFDPLSFDTITQAVNLIELEKPLTFIPSSLANLFSGEENGVYIDMKETKFVELEINYLRILLKNNDKSLDIKLAEFDALTLFNKFDSEYNPDAKPRDVEKTADTIEKLEKRFKKQRNRKLLKIIQKESPHLVEIPYATIPTFIDIASIAGAEITQTGDMKLFFKDDPSRISVVVFDTHEKAQSALDFLLQESKKLNPTPKQSRKLQIKFKP